MVCGPGTPGPRVSRESVKPVRHRDGELRVVDVQVKPVRLDARGERLCRDELEDVEVLEARTAGLLTRWRRKTSALELRAGLVGFELLASENGTMLLTDLDHVDADELAERFAADPTLRGAIAIYDLARLEKINTVKSSVFVYVEWFLRDAYGVKLLPSAAFTQGLIARGVISLGFG
jgi:hypothetical protein